MTKILVIEDDSTVRALICKLLKAEGFDIVSGADGQVGIQLARIHAPDLIICDIMMPECDGYEVLTQLRQDSATSGIPFIFLSAKADRTDLRQGMNLGADDYVTKPFKRNELLGAITARLAKQTTITQPYIDEMKRAAQNLNQLAYIDPLTSLPNRILFHYKLQEALKVAERSQQTTAVMCLNLNGFKAINTNLGYSSGDMLLQEVAERLNRTLGSTSTVARLGGDEFGLLLHQVSSKQAGEIGQKILDALADLFDLDGQYVQMHTSLGIALAPEDSNHADSLLMQADTAMRYAKGKNRSRLEFYRAEMDVLEAERQQIYGKLNDALDKQEFELNYQPQVNLVTGRIIGAEALLRWRQPDLGLVSPAKFIPIAEETGLIVTVGEWVLLAACTQAMVWQQQSSQRLIRVSVNLSARQFKQQNLVKTVEQTLQKTGLNPDLLVLELTETSVMENVETTIVTLQELKAMGVHISIDDFGTGYSSLNYLKRFPIDTLKIDQSFIRDITTDLNDAAIAKAIIAMSQSLQLKVIAEGVETEDQLNFLRQNGCHAMQGYFFSHPLSADEFVQFLAEDRRL